MSEYSKINSIYEGSNENYHGGYLLEQEQEQKQNIQDEYKYLGGKERTIISRFDKMVIPFGLFYKNRTSDLHEHLVNRLLDEEEAKCIEPDVFDRLFYAVGYQKREKYPSSKTVKNSQK